MRFDKTHFNAMIEMMNRQAALHGFAILETFTIITKKINY